MAASSRLTASRPAHARGFTLIELLITMGITTVILGATMVAMNNALSATQTATQVGDLNNTLRTAMDLMVRDILQTGQGLPAGRRIQIPNGSGVVTMQLPGPKDTDYTYEGPSFCPPRANDNDNICEEVMAVIPGPGRGPSVDGGPNTDMLTVLMVDSAFDSADLIAFATDGRSVTVATPCATPTPCPTASGTGAQGHRISDNPDVDLDNIRPGDLIMLTRNSNSTLVEVSSVTGQQIFFAPNDSLRLNQPSATGGTTGIRTQPNEDKIPSPQTAPPKYLLDTKASRVRMISYYLDVQADPKHPRLIRRINNGGTWNDFNNDNGTVVAFDIESLQFTYDLSDGATNPSNVRMTDADFGTNGACKPNICYPSQIRKINIYLSGRSRLPRKASDQYFRARLVTQVSLRSLSFVDKYKDPVAPQ